MTSYGLQIGSLPAITGGRKIMRLLALGSTVHTGGRRHKFPFVCGHRDFCVYFRPLNAGIPTASQTVCDQGGGRYEAFFVGSPCRVYVYERKSAASQARYGLFLYNGRGETAFDDEDEPMCALPNLYIPPLGIGGRVRLFDAATAARRAVNLHCVRGALTADFGNKTYCVYRDAVVLDTDGGLDYAYGLGGTFRRFSGAAHNIPYDTSTSGNRRWSMLSPQRPTSVGVADTSIHD